MNYDFLESAVRKSKLPKMEFYSMIGLTAEGFRGSVKNRTMKVETLEKISEVLNIPIHSFFSENPEISVVEDGGLNYKTDYKQQLIESQQEQIRLHKKIEELQEIINAFNKASK